MLCLASYAKRNNDTLYLDFEPCCDDNGELLRDRMDVVVRLANGFTLGTLCTITTKGVIRSYITDDDFGDFFGFDADGYYDDITKKEEF